MWLCVRGLGPPYKEGALAGEARWGGEGGVGVCKGWGREARWGGVGFTLVLV